MDALPGSVSLFINISLKSTVCSCGLQPVRVKHSTPVRSYSPAAPVWFERRDLLWYWDRSVSGIPLPRNRKVLSAWVLGGILSTTGRSRVGTRTSPPKAAV